MRAETVPRGGNEDDKSLSQFKDQEFEVLTLMFTSMRNKNNSNHENSRSYIEIVSIPLPFYFHDHMNQVKTLRGKKVIVPYKVSDLTHNHTHQKTFHHLLLSVVTESSNRFSSSHLPMYLQH